MNYNFLLVVFCNFCCINLRDDDYLLLMLELIFKKREVKACEREREKERGREKEESIIIFCIWLRAFGLGVLSLLFLLFCSIILGSRVLIIYKWEKKSDDNISKIWYLFLGLFVFCFFFISRILIFRLALLEFKITWIHLCENNTIRVLHIDKNL